MPEGVVRPMHFTGDISLGTIVTIITILGVAMTIGQRFGRVETTIESQAKMLTDHAMRLGKYEQQSMRFVADLQRLVGRVEMLMDRRKESRD